MANSALYWITEGSTLQTITFTNGVSRLHLHEQRVGAAGATTLGGRRAYHPGRAQTRLEVIIDRDKVAAHRRDIGSMLSHLQLGGWCAFAGDVNKIAAGFHAGTLALGTTLIKPGAYPFDAPATATTLLAADEVYIEGCNAALGQREMTTLSGIWASSGGLLTLGEAIRYERTNDAPILIRSRDYYPRLILPADQQRGIIRSFHHRQNYDFKLTLEVDYGGLVRVFEEGT